MKIPRFFLPGILPGRNKIHRQVEIVSIGGWVILKSIMVPNFTTIHNWMLQTLISISGWFYTEKPLSWNKVNHLIYFKKQVTKLLSAALKRRFLCFVDEGISIPHSNTLSHLTYDMRHCWSQGPAGECSIITHARGTQYSALTLPAATACNVPSFQGHSKPSYAKPCQAEVGRPQR